MRLIQKLPPQRPPARCIVYPHRTEDPKGFIETGRILDDNGHVIENRIAGKWRWDTSIFISHAAVIEMAELCGMVRASYVEKIETAQAELNAKLSEANERIDKLTRYAELEEEIGEWVEVDSEVELKRAAELEAAEVG